MSEPRTCSECGRKLDGIMVVHEDAPGLIDTLRGEGGERRRILVTLAVCLLVALIAVGVHQMLVGS